MQVNGSERYIDFVGVEQYLTEESKKRIKTAAEGRFGEMWALHIGDFFNCLKGDFSVIGFDREHPENTTVLQKAWLDLFAEFAKEFITTLTKLQLPQSPEQKAAADACLPVTFEESVLVFTRNYFGLQSFAAVEELPLSDYMIAKKDAYNTAAFNKKLAQIEAAKYRKK